MQKKFSINELILASNNILASNFKKKNSLNNIIPKKFTDTKIKQDRPDRLELKQIIVEKKLPIKKKNNYLPQTVPDFTTKLKEDVKPSTVDELYNLFKKKVKRNTLKMIVDQQLETKNFQKKINYLNTNINNLENHNKNLRINLDAFSKDKELLESDNKTLLDKFKKTSQENNILEVNNLEFQNNLDIQNKNNQLLTQNNKLMLSNNNN